VIDKAYPRNRHRVGFSIARSSSNVEMVAIRIVSAYGRTSWANRLTAGSRAKMSPAVTAVRRLKSRCPTRLTQAAEPAMASNDGRRIAVAESPNT
jgi:hypothetical protein